MKPENKTIWIKFQWKYYLSIRDNINSMSSSSKDAFSVITSKHVCAMIEMWAQEKI